MQPVTMQTNIKMEIPMKDTEYREYIAQIETHQKLRVAIDHLRAQLKGFEDNSTPRSKLDVEEIEGVINDLSKCLTEYYTASIKLEVTSWWKSIVLADMLFEIPNVSEYDPYNSGAADYQLIPESES